VTEAASSFPCPNCGRSLVPVGVLTTKMTVRVSLLVRGASFAGVPLSVADSLIGYEWY
jgi:hypothetical protein